MAEAKITIEKRFGVILSLEEIKYLKELTQNYWKQDADDVEPYNSSVIRESIWTAMNELEKANG